MIWFHVRWRAELKLSREWDTWYTITAHDTSTSVLFVVEIVGSEVPFYIWFLVLLLQQLQQEEGMYAQQRIKDMLQERKERLKISIHSLHDVHVLFHTLLLS